MSYCEFDIQRLADGKYDAVCRACGRRVVAKSDNIVAACRSSSDYKLSRDRIALAAAGRGGPGTELKSLLSDWLGFTAEPGCACERRALVMDMWGPDECERRIDEIVGWLREEHSKRRDAGETRLPWTDFGATQLVKLACRRARTKSRIDAVSASGTLH